MDACMVLIKKVLHRTYTLFENFATTFGMFCILFGMADVDVDD